MGICQGVLGVLGSLRMTISPNRFQLADWLNDISHGRDDDKTDTEARMEAIAALSLANLHLIRLLFADMKARDPVQAERLLDRIRKQVAVDTEDEVSPVGHSVSAAERGLGEAYTRSLELFLVLAE